jgi:hypothetical protein
MVQDEAPDALSREAATPPTRWKSWDSLFSHYRVVGALMATFAIVSVVWSAWVQDEGVRKWLVAVWSVAPALWFFLEFHWARATKTDAAELNDIKDSQELAGKIWAGVVTALSVLYLKG